MGRQNKKYHRDLKQQVYDRLTPMLKAGEGTSRKAAKADGSERYKIFSYSTYETYRKHCNYFCDYVREYHPECTTIKKAEKYMSEWLQRRVDQVDMNGKHLSAWTIQTEAKALGKLYGITQEDPHYFHPPQRKREDIVRSRGDKVRDKHFSEKNNDELVKFCRGTGCRRNVLERLRGRDLVTRGELEKEYEELKVKEDKGMLGEGENARLQALKDVEEHFKGQDYFIHHRGDKGGRERFAPIVGPNKEQIVERMRNTAPDEKVWQHVSGNADIHGYRGDYATFIYRAYARPIEEIPYDKENKGTKKLYQKDVYVCRKDEKGKKLDKKAMTIASKALGHNRLEVVANNYIRGL